MKHLTILGEKPLRDPSIRKRIKERKFKRLLPGMETELQPLERAPDIMSILKAKLLNVMARDNIKRRSRMITFNDY